LKYEQEEDDD